MKTHRSTSPITTSREPITAITSAIMPPTMNLCSAWHAIRPGRAHVHAPRAVGAVRHDVTAMLAARPFHRHIGITGGHLEALRVDQEVLNQRFHFRVDLVLRRRHDALVVARPGADRRNALERLVADLDALAHLGDAREVAIVDVAVRGADHVELVGVVADVRERAAHVVVAAGGARDRAEQSPLAAVFERDHADAARAIEPDRVLGDQRLVFIELAGEAIEKRLDRLP